MGLARGSGRSSVPRSSIWVMMGKLWRCRRSSLSGAVRLSSRARSLRCGTPREIAPRSGQRVLASVDEGSPRVHRTAGGGIDRSPSLDEACVHSAIGVCDLRAADRSRISASRIADFLGRRTWRDEGIETFVPTTRDRVVATRARASKAWRASARRRCASPRIMEHSRCDRAPASAVGFEPRTEPSSDAHHAAKDVTDDGGVLCLRACERFSIGRTELAGGIVERSPARRGSLNELGGGLLLEKRSRSL